MKKSNLIYGRAYIGYGVFVINSSIDSNDMSLYSNVMSNMDVQAK